MDREIWRGKDVGLHEVKKENEPRLSGRTVWFLSIDGNPEV